MEELEQIKGKLQQGQKLVDNTRLNLKQIGDQTSLNYLAAAQAHIDQAGQSIAEGRELKKAGWHIQQVTKQLNYIIERLKD